MNQEELHLPELSAAKKSDKLTNQLILVAAGSGKRYGLEKQFIEIVDLPLFFHALLRFCPQVCFENIVVVVPHKVVGKLKERIVLWFEVAESFFLKKLSGEHFPMAQKWLRTHKNNFFIVAGGNERWQSVHLGLQFLDKVLTRDGKNSTKVWVHDAARALLAKNDLGALIEASNNPVFVNNKTGVIPCRKIVDTIKTISPDRNSYLKISGNVNRDLVVTVSTPQIFPYSKLLESYKILLEGGNLVNETSKKDTFVKEDFLHGKQKITQNLITDDAAVYLAAGNKVAAVPLFGENLKLTFQSESQNFFTLLESKTLFLD